MKAQRSLELWATYCLMKLVSFTHWHKNADNGFIAFKAVYGNWTRQWHVWECPFMNDIYLWNRFKCCPFNLFMYSFIYLLIFWEYCEYYLYWTGKNWIWLKLAWAQKAVYKKKKISKTEKNIYLYLLYVCPFLYWVSEDKNVNVFAVTLLFILPMSSFTRDSFLSLCQSPAPPHFCTDDVK